MRLITSGSKYIDIDAYAAMNAYSFLLNNLGVTAIPYSKARLNSSVVPTLGKIGSLVSDYNPKSEDEFVVLDVSNPKFISPEILNGKIAELIDHHFGFENYWFENFSGIAQIEKIGSICTIIFEKYIEYNKKEILTEEIAKLLVAGIIDNTLFLKADVTTERDRNAYAELSSFIAGGSDTFSIAYFKEFQDQLLLDFKNVILSDIKDLSNFDKLPAKAGQLVLWDEEELIENKMKIIFQSFEGESDWFLNVISLSLGKSYLISNRTQSILKLEKLFDIKFDNNVGVLDGFILRKEIIERAI